ncbi:MAG: hypothetical protein H0T62_06655 [Parachlamydiaceae bacterium]|nr:hypothetical protein [Parachlamydiaceae bacterium]
MQYDPPSEENRIGDGIEYLMGVDLKPLGGTYLHSLESFIQYKAEKKF